MNELEEIRRKKMEKLKKRYLGGGEMDVTDSDFQEKVIEKSKEVPVVVDFWAEWCAPCKMLSPVLEKVEKDYDGKFVLAKANVDEAKKTAQKYGIRSIPSVKIFKDKEVVGEFIGAIPEDAVKDWLEKNLE